MNHSQSFSSAAQWDSVLCSSQLTINLLIENELWLPTCQCINTATSHHIDFQMIFYPLKVLFSGLWMCFTEFTIC